MSDYIYATEARGDEGIESCEDCGRPIYEGVGILTCNGDDAAWYAYRWSEGHDSRFSLAVAGVTNGLMRDGFVVVSSYAIDDQLHYSVVDPTDSPWGDSDNLGRVLTREEALDGHLYPDLFTLIDAITLNEPRLARRIVAAHGHDNSFKPKPLLGSA